MDHTHGLKYHIHPKHHNSFLQHGFVSQSQELSFRLPLPVFWHRLLRQFRLLSRCTRTSFITSDFPYYNFNIFQNYLLIVCNPVSRLRNGCSTFLLYIFYYDKPIYFFLIIYYSLNFEHFVHILFTNFSQSHHTIDTIQLYTLSIS